MISRKYAPLLGLATAVVLAAGAAKAEKPDTTADLRCLAVAMAMAGSPDPKVRDDGVFAAYYYLGRIDGREPNLNLEASLIAQFKALGAGGAKTEIQTCGLLMAARTKAITDAAHNVQPKIAQPAP